MGTNTDVIVPLPKEDMRRQYNLPLDAHILVHVGLATYDARLLARTFAEIARRDPKAYLLLVGKEMAEMTQIALEADVEGRIVKTGFTPYKDIGGYLACGDVMLLPYTNQPVINTGRYLNKLGDYMAAGRPTVTNPTGDIATLFHADQIGILADETPQAMADTVELLLKDDALRDDLGRQARKVAATRLSWRQLSLCLVEFYQTVIKLA